MYLAQSLNIICFQSWATDNGFGEMFPKSELMANLAYTYCRDGVPTQALCTIAIFMIGGWSENQHNAVRFIKNM